MLIHYCSDLHLDFHDVPDEFYVGGEVLILAGDIVEAVRIHKRKEFWDRISESWNQVLYTPGNHEYYHSACPKAEDTIREFLVDYENINLYQNQPEILNDVLFFGTTLWTDLNRNPMAQLEAMRRMNDYKLIRLNDEGYQKMYPERTILMHDNAVEALKQNLKIGFDKVVVFTHHAPSEKSVHPDYKHDVLMNYSYFSPLDDLIEENSCIKAWIHGHTHRKFDYKIGECRVLCNPYGYPRERPSYLPAYTPSSFEI